MKTTNRMARHLNGTAAPSAPYGYGWSIPPLSGAEPNKAKPPDGRDPTTGRFAPGNVAALGHVNPTARARADLQNALIAAVSAADVAAIARRLRDDALRGSVASAELLLRYAVGRPATADDPDRVDLESWKLIQSWPWLSEFLVTVGRAVHPATASEFARHLVTATGESVVQKLSAAEDDEDETGETPIGKQAAALIERRVTKGK